MADTPRCEFEGKNLILKLQKTLEGRIEAIPPFIQGIMEVVESMGCAAGQEREVEIALLEALSNAVIHGCKNDPLKKVECCVACDESQGSLIVVRYPGEGFYCAAIPSPIVRQNLFPAYGRGIFMITQPLDEV